MNRFIIFFPICVVFILSSCTRNLYQVFDVKSSNVKLDSVAHSFKFEDSTVIISYNLWGKYGVLNFSIYNKSSRPIYLDWNKSNFIRNSYSFDYFQATEKLDVMSSYQLNTTRRYNLVGNTNATINSSGYNANTSGVLTENSQSTFFGTSTYLLKKEKPVNQLPPSSFINVSTFYIGRDFFTGINSVPKDNSVITTNFDKKNSPIDFRNYLAYSFDQHLDSMKFIDNDFWIDKINTYGGLLYVNNKLNFNQPNEFWADAIIPKEKKYFSSFIYFTPSWSIFDLEIAGFTGTRIKPNFDLTVGITPSFGFFAKSFYHYGATLYYSVPETLKNSFAGAGIAFNTRLTAKSILQFFFDFGPGYVHTFSEFKYSYRDEIETDNHISFTSDLGFRIFPVKNFGINISTSTTYVRYADVQINFGLVGKIPLKK